MGYGMMENSGYMGWGGMFFGGFMMLFWIAVIVALIVLLIKWIKP